MKPSKFILIDTGSESNRIMMSDVGKMENGIQRTRTYETGNKFLEALIHLHFSYAITQFVNLPGKVIWNRYCVLDELIEDGGFEYFIIIVNNAIHRLSVKHLNELQRRSNVHIFSLILDPFEHLPKNVRKQLMAVEWDKVFSFQRSDCEKYGFEFTDKIYSKADIEKYAVPSDPKTDVYFVGLAKDRMEKIFCVYRFLTEKGCKCDFTVIVGKDELAEYKAKYKGISFETSRVPYTEVLRKLSATKSILELCAEGQDGLTMRFYEAAFYNKLLITNNQTAKNSELYNPIFMQVVRDYSEIDAKAILETEEIDYNYNGDFSPVHFVSRLPEYVKG